MQRVIARAKAEGIPTTAPAAPLAQERIDTARKVKRLYFE